MPRKTATHYREYLHDSSKKPPYSTWKNWLKKKEVTVEQLREMGINPVQRRKRRKDAVQVTPGASNREANDGCAGPSTSATLNQSPRSPIVDGLTNRVVDRENLVSPTPSSTLTVPALDEAAESDTFPPNLSSSLSASWQAHDHNIVADLDGSIISLTGVDSEQEVSDLSDDEYFDVEEPEDNDGNYDFIYSKSIGHEVLNEPLMPPLTVTKFETLLMILHIALRHGMTDVLLEDLMKFVNQLVGVPDALPTSKFLFHKLFMCGTRPTVHFYCPSCSVYLAPAKSYTDVVNCNSCDFSRTVSSLNGGFYFLTLSIRDQIKEVLHRPNLKLIDKETRLEKIISDFVDGKVYKSLQKNNGILSNKNALTITFSTDGSVVFKHGESNSVWPLHFYLNELHPKDRFRTENMLLGGLWFGPSEPNMQIYMRPFVEELLELSRCGIIWRKSDGSVVESPVYALCCCTDAVAKAKVQNMMQFNGRFGCGYCLHPNESLTMYELVDTRRGFTVRPQNDENFQNQQPVYRKRTLMRYLRGEHRMRDEKELREQMHLIHNSPVQQLFGAVGMSVLFPLFYFNMVYGFGIDYMHAVLIGVVKRLADLWFDTTSNSSPYYIGRLIHLVDRRLSEITVPSFMRKPRPMSDRCHWKANEWRNFLLYYGLPCLANILPLEYYNHFKKLVTAIYLLSKESILHDEVDEAHKLLQDFVWDYQDLYGEANMVYNVHVTGHLAVYVSKMGPLWAYSAFPFESANGRLVRMVKGTRGVATQIARKYLMSSTTSKLLRNGYRVSDETIDFCSSIIGYTLVQKAEKHGGVTVFGTGSPFPLNDEQRQAFLDKGLELVSTVCAFNRAVANGALYHGKLTSRQKKSSDSCVRLASGEFALIEVIFKVESMFDHSDKIWCVVKKLNISLDPSPLMVPHIKQCSLDPFGDTKLVAFNEIVKKCMFFACNDKHFIAEFSNTFETD